MAATAAERDLIAANALGKALYSPMYEDAPSGTPSTARFLFLIDKARDFFIDWPKASADLVANLRTELARDSRDRDLTDLVDELHRDSEEFRPLWKTARVSARRHGVDAAGSPYLVNG